MEKYENLGMIGEGSYGMVMKCRHKETKQLVAIKKFLETEEDKNVKKIAMREVRMLKQVRHENLINLIEVFRRKKRLYLVFEFVDHTALDDLERYPTGAEEGFVKRIIFQVLRGVEFCHAHSIIHRDVKPENILISKRGVVKLCDFGFARTIAPPGESYTDYVATRWYRAPELLVGDTNYGRAIDIWAIGCLFSEMLTGEPLFPGESDIDQLYLITKCFGNLIARHREIFSRNPLFLGMRLPEARELEPLERRYPHLSPAIMDIVRWSLRLDPNDRPTCSQLLRHELFTKGGWGDRFTFDLRGKVEHELEDNPLLKAHGNYAILQDARRKTTSEGQSTMPNPPKRHAQAMLDEATTTTATNATSTDVSLSDAEALARKKEKKKKKTKTNKDLLHHRDKAQPEKIKTTKQQHSSLQPPHLMPPPLYASNKLPLTTSHHSLAGSRTQLLEPLPHRNGAPTGYEFTTHITAPTPGVQITSPNPIGHTHSSNKQHNNFALISPHPYPPTSIPNRTLSPSNSTQPMHRINSLKTIVSPPVSVISPGASILDGPTIRHTSVTGYGGSTTSLSNQQQGYLQAEHTSEVSLISEKGTRYRSNKPSSLMVDKMLGITSPNHYALRITSPNHHHTLTSPLGSPGAGVKHLGGGGGGSVSYKKQYAKNKDTILLPHLKDSEFHHTKPVTTHAPIFPISSGSQSSGLGVGPVGTGLGNRGLLLGSINPHITSIESFRGAVNMRAPPTPPSHGQHASHQAIR